MPAQVLRHAAKLIMNYKEDRYGMLKAFQLASSNHLSVNKDPLPDGDESFAYWFKNTVVEFYKNL
jgi:hypothetical protein